MSLQKEWILERDAASGLARWNGKQPERLGALCAEMGIRFPVVVKRMRGGNSGTKHNGKAGIETLADGSYRHVIKLSPLLNVYQANATLKHELQHSAQFERAVVEGKDWREYMAKYSSEGRSGKAYRRNRFEVEAREAPTKYAIDAITQPPLLSERQRQAVLSTMRRAFACELPRFQREMATNPDLDVCPALRAHFAALIAAPAPIVEPLVVQIDRAAINALEQRRAREQEARRAQQTTIEGARCKACGKPYDARRKALGYDVCMPCSRRG